MCSQNVNLPILESLFSLNGYIGNISAERS